MRILDIILALVTFCLFVLVGYESVTWSHDNKVREHCTFVKTDLGEPYESCTKRGCERLQLVLDRYSCPMGPDFINRGPIDATQHTSATP
jgi:hypothetical protein